MNEAEMKQEMQQRMLGGTCRQIAFDELDNGFKVSTAHTTDEGFETALFGICYAKAQLRLPARVEGRVHVVERYEDEEAAKEGHARWVATAAEEPAEFPALRIRPILTLIIMPVDWKSTRVANPPYGTLGEEEA